MKKWEKPELCNLNFNETNTQSDYITVCNWDEAVWFAKGNGNEEYRDPNNKPAQHPDWVWCHLHNRWHPKDHGEGDQTLQS